jgi:acyl-CoA synthetase (AMP-forming)/AMP-acid ligase II
MNAENLTLDERGLLASDRSARIPPSCPPSIRDILAAPLAEMPDREALVGRNGRYTYAELDREVRRAASVMWSLGVRPGERVAACLPNDVDIVIAFLATQRLGAIWVGINAPLAPPEKLYMLNDSGAVLLLASPACFDEVSPRRSEAAALRHIVRVDPTSADGEWRKRLREAGDAEPAAIAAIAAIVADPFAPAAIAYTSGTTGLPKGAVHSQRNMLMPGVVFRLQRRYPEGARQGSVLPMTILNLFTLEVLPALTDRRCLVCIDRIDAPGLAEWIEKEQVGVLTAVPTVFHDLLNNPAVRPGQLDSLVAPGAGGADVPPEIIRLYKERHGRDMVIGYGMTEAPTVVCWSDGSTPTAPGLCGTPLAHLCIDIRDDDGKVLPAGEVGEICVSPATSGDYAGLYTPMLGYWNKPDATRAALQGGVYHTGDMGFFAPDGNLYIKGRRNQMIIRGGANVYPAEVERVLDAHPAVLCAAVLGVADARLGERVVAAVQLRPGASVEGEALRAHALQQLARYKAPDEFRFVETMPRNAMNKIIKADLRHLFKSSGTD